MTMAIKSLKTTTKPLEKKDKSLEKKIKEQIETAEIERQGALLSPAGLIMLPLAAIIDIIDFFIGSLLILDIVAILVIGGWIYSRSGQLKATRGATARLGKAAKWAKRLRWLRPLLIAIEFIPIVGMLPLWVLLVYFELKQ